MTNLERWRDYTSNLFSPDSWIEFGWLYVISSALQRRVWYGNRDHNPLFGNLYGVLCGPPGCGKGLVLGAAKKLLRHHKLELKGYDEKAKMALQSVTDADGDIFLFPQGPNDCTYEALARRMARSMRRIEYTNHEGKKLLYTHSSVCFILPEFKSLFKRREDKLPTMTLQLYDCDDPYIYETKNKETDTVRRPCLSILSACVPEFIGEAEEFKIFNTGFLSRTIFAFEHTQRFGTFFLKDITAHQSQHFLHLVEHVGNLSKLYGSVEVTDECKKYLEEWYQDVHVKQENSSSGKMSTYFARKRVHIMKLAMAYHFSESLELCVELGCFKRAIEFLSKLEAGMKWGFSSGGRNELATIARDVLKHIRCSSDEWVSRAQLVAEFSSDIRLSELDEILLQLQMLNKIKCDGSDRYAYRR